MKIYLIIVVLILNCLVVQITCKGFYSIIAPGGLKLNRKYTVVVSLHEADEPSVINVRIEGPFYYTAQDVQLQPYETKSIVFELPKLASGNHKLVAESKSGLTFRNETRITYNNWVNGVQTLIQTDKAKYKPGDEVQFRVVLLDQHTRPMKIEEPVLVEILDPNRIRVKQFKDIRFIKGIYKGKFQLSAYPTLGRWHIKVTISGKYDETTEKFVQVEKYVLPKFSVYIKTDENFLPLDRVIKSLVYGKYTFDKYVEGNLTARIINPAGKKVLQQKQMNINSTAVVEFSFENPNDFDNIFSVELSVDLTEKHTGLTRSHSTVIQIRKQRYKIGLDSDSIEYEDNKPYRLKVFVRHWNDSLVLDRHSPVVMKHGSKDYKAYLDDNGEAIFQFDYDSEAKHSFKFENSTLESVNINRYRWQPSNYTKSYCKLRLKGDSPRLGTKLEVEVSSIDDIPYLIYVIMGHASIIKAQHIKLPPNQKTYTIEITPSIEMVPRSFIYVHYIQNGNLRYDELALIFPAKFENQISVVAPKHVEPGRNVTIELKAQPNSYVGLMAVDLGVYLLDSSYDLNGKHLMNNLRYDETYSPTTAIVYPGLLSGTLTLTNAHFTIVLPKSAGGGGGFGGAYGGILPPKYREKFPETWIFENYEITNDTTQLALTVPDSITTWRITAFSVNDVTGFGIVDGPTDIIARQAFFITLNLPYSVKRGEIITLPIIVYNYNNQSVDTEITLYNDDQEFQFIESTNVTAAERLLEEQERVKRLHLAENGVDKVAFLIQPKRVGELRLRVTAINSISSDAVIRKLKVEPEGVAKRENKPLYVRISEGGKFNSTITTDLPADMVPESEYLTLSVGGDSLVPTLKNLNSLVLLPTGCGEQNMVNFAPNILVLQYLKATGNYFRERTLVSKAKNFIDIGYQQQLSYRHQNGAYSVFGPKDREASTWLTAYVIRFFIKVSNHQSIEPSVIESGLEYLAKAQLVNGGFPFTGYLFYTAQQNRFGFTAFVLMTFMENKKYATQYENTINKGLAFLKNNLDKIEDIYALAIVANALQMAKHESAQQVIGTLKLRKQQKGNNMWWSQNDRNREKDVEITAYVLMALLEVDNNPTEDLYIHKWLLDQRNARGGFKSTHDTVVGLQALVKFSQKYRNSDNMNLKIKYAAKNSQSEIVENNELTVDANNLLIMQTKELPHNTRAVDVNVTGSGNSLIQLSYQYNMATDDEFKHFRIKPKAMMPNSDEMLLEICFTYQQPNITENEIAASANMIIMEANLPSGFTSNDEFSTELLENEIIHRIESKNAETTLVIYFKKITANVNNCLNIIGAKIHDVLQRKPAVITVYDYYNITRQNTEFYNV